LGKRESLYSEQFSIFTIWLFQGRYESNIDFI
jgi:hypothetical protein